MNLASDCNMSGLGALIRKGLLQYIEIQVQLSNSNANQSTSNQLLDST